MSRAMKNAHFPGHEMMVEPGYDQLRWRSYDAGALRQGTGRMEHAVLLAVVAPEWQRLGRRPFTSLVLKWQRVDMMTVLKLIV